MDDLANVIGEASKGPGPIKVQRMPQGYCEHIANAVRAYLESSEVVERVCAAAVPEPTHLYPGRGEQYRTSMRNAVKTERLVFECKWRDAIAALNAAGGKQDG